MLDEDRARFESLVLPHLDAAYNLARWLTHDDHDAEDVVHEAVLRAMRHLGDLRGESGRPWLLQIVRNACWTWLQKNRPAHVTSLVDDDEAALDVAVPVADEPPALAMRNADRRRINDAIAGLPAAFREVIVLREFEDLSYNEIARIADIPVGTVMSRLSRARGLLRDALSMPVRPALRPVPTTARRGGTP